MKKSLLLISLISTMAFAQKKSCCQITITDKNTMLALNSAFVLTHIEPLSYTLENPKGEMVTFKTDDGKTGGAYFIKAEKQPAKKALFIFHEWWGLNDYIKKETDNFHNELPGVDIYAVDLYDGRVGNTREEAQKYMSEMTDEHTRAIIRGAFTFSGKKIKKVATLGWCMGGSWSLQAALEKGKSMKACVMYYGMPENDLEKLKNLRCDVLGIFAEKDKFINVDTVKAFENNMKKVNKEIVVFNYVADHAFANPSNPQFNKEATKDAHEKVIVYLKKRLKIKEIKNKH